MAVRAAPPLGGTSSVSREPSNPPPPPRPRPSTSKNRCQHILTCHSRLLWMPASRRSPSSPDQTSPNATSERPMTAHRRSPRQGLPGQMNVAPEARWNSTLRDRNVQSSRIPGASMKSCSPFSCPPPDRISGSIRAWSIELGMVYKFWES